MPKALPDPVSLLGETAKRFMDDGFRLRDLITLFTAGAYKVGSSASHTDGRPIDLGATTRLFQEVLLQRAVDNFLCYITEIMSVVFIQRPEMLKTSGMIAIEDALECEDRSELIAFVVERRIEELSFKGLADLSSELLRKYHIELFENDEALRYACALVEKRNLIAHNRGIVNQRYLDRVHGAPEKIGDRVDSTEFGAALTFFMPAMTRIYKLVAVKFFGVSLESEA